MMKWKYTLRHNTRQEKSLCLDLDICLNFSYSKKNFFLGFKYWVYITIIVLKNPKCKVKFHKEMLYDFHFTFYKLLSIFITITINYTYYHHR